MKVLWPVDSRKPKYVAVSEESGNILLPNRNYVLIRRFSAKEEKRRLVAAPLIRKNINSEHIGIENHLNYIYRKGGQLSEVETTGLAAILSSSLLDSYFRIFSGNTQVSATELRNFPLPPQQIIRKIGAMIQEQGIDFDQGDERITSVIREYAT